MTYIDMKDAQFLLQNSDGHSFHKYKKYIYAGC